MRSTQKKCFWHSCRRGEQPLQWRIFFSHFYCFPTAEASGCSFQFSIYQCAFTSEAIAFIVKRSPPFYFVDTYSQSVKNYFPAPALCKIFSISRKCLSSLAESSYKKYNKITSLLLKIHGLLFSHTKILVEDHHRSHIPPSFSPTVLDKMRICDTLYVLSLEGSIVSFFCCFF